MQRVIYSLLRQNSRYHAKMKPLGFLSIWSALSCSFLGKWMRWYGLQKFSKYLFWINLMPQVPVIPTFLMLSPKSIQMLRYTYVSMRSEKLGNTLRNHWGNYILVNSSRERKCLIYIRCVSVCISRMYDTNIISFHTIHFHLKTSRHLNWNP